MSNGHDDDLPTDEQIEQMTAFERELRSLHIRRQALRDLRSELRDRQLRNDDQQALIKSQLVDIRLEISDIQEDIEDLGESLVATRPPSADGMKALRDSVRALELFNIKSKTTIQILEAAAEFAEAVMDIRSG